MRYGVIVTGSMLDDELAQWKFYDLSVALCEQLEVLSSAQLRRQLCVKRLLSIAWVLGAGLWLVLFGLVIVPTPRLHSSRWLWGEFEGNTQLCGG